MQAGIGRRTKAGLLCLLALHAATAFAASDADLQRRIQARLAKAGFEQRADIQGVVRLSGWVETSSKRDEIEERLARVDAIRDVHNDLRLQGFSQGDVRLRLEIHEKIYTDPLFARWAGLPDPPVRVFVDRGRATLVGTVGSDMEKVVVGMLARGTLAFAVNNQVKVEGEDARKEERKKDSTES
jgi:osmotically-inducible protein OsmY